MRRTILGFAFLALALPVTTFAAGSITVPKKVPYSKDVHIPDAVRAECGLEQKTAEYVRDALGGKFDKVSVADSVSGSTPGKALSLKITSVLAPGGGAWSGPKSVTVEGTLYDGGKTIGSFTARRHTTRGHGTCGMLQRDAKEIADDISKWIGSPGMGDKLGDAAK
jgi:hypothetical protein